jgi:dipeptidyl aminopeptidase/acylaminoacyl peptidase
VSPDGRLAVTTVFETGHSYADAAFSTRTILIDTATGRRIADLEEFSIDRDGRPFKAADFNFWGVTFASDGDSFFATVKTAGQSYLIKGSIKARHASVLRSGVECPSLSPDGSLLVYKKPLVGEIGWRLHVLDLATQHERPLNQVARSIDDQVDWFDDQQVIYHDSAETGTGVWVLPVDGVSPPRLLLPFAYSPAVQR